MGRSIKLKTNIAKYAIEYQPFDMASIAVKPNLRNGIGQPVYQSATLTAGAHAPTASPPGFGDDFFDTAFEGLTETAPAEAKSGKTALGALKGYLEDCSPDRIAGWAQNSRPGAPPVQVAIMLGRLVLAELVAESWRADLSAADIGTGHHAFEFRPVPPIASDLLGAVKVVRVADKAELPRVFGLVNQ
jgi:hypothetical protein